MVLFFVLHEFVQHKELSKLVLQPLAEQALAAPDLWQLVAKELKQI